MIGAAGLAGVTLYKKNVALEVEVSAVTMQLKASESTVEAMEDDKRTLDAIHIGNKREQALVGRKMDALESELERLANESTDECLGRDIPSDISDRL